MTAVLCLRLYESGFTELQLFLPEFIEKDFLMAQKYMAQNSAIVTVNELVRRSTKGQQLCFA